MEIYSISAIYQFDIYFLFCYYRCTIIIDYTVYTTLACMFVFPIDMELTLSVSLSCGCTRIRLINFAHKSHIERRVVLHLSTHQSISFDRNTHTQQGRSKCPYLVYLLPIGFYRPLFTAHLTHTQAQWGFCLTNSYYSIYLCGWVGTSILGNNAEETTC